MNALEQDIPKGFCQCGCGQKTSLARQTFSGKGYAKGEPLRFIHGHNSRTQNPIINNLKNAYRVNDETGCWEWIKGSNGNGYGALWNGKRAIYPHRYFYELVNGPIPEGLEIDHLCRNHACVNPDHLEAVTRTTNSRRGARTKLTWELVEEIRTWAKCKNITRKAIASVYGMSKSQIAVIIREEQWRGEAEA